MRDLTQSELESYPGYMGPGAGIAYSTSTMDRGMGPDRGVGMGPRMGPGAGIGMGPRMGPGMGPGMGQRMGSSSISTDAILGQYANALGDQYIQPTSEKLNNFINDIARAEKQTFGGGGQSNVSPGFSQGVGAGIVGAGIGSIFGGQFGGGQSNSSPDFSQGVGAGIGSVFSSLFGGQSNSSPFGGSLLSGVSVRRMEDGGPVPVPAASVPDGDSSLTFEDEVLSDYARLEELRGNINDSSSAVELRELENFQNILLSKYGSFGAFERLLSEALPEYKAVFDASSENYSNLLEDAGAVNTLNREAPAEDVFPLDLEYPAKDDVARATAYGSSGGIGAYAAEPKKESVSPVTMAKRPESRAQVRSPRPIRAPGGAPLNNTEYLAVPEYMQRPPYFDFNPSAGADFTQQLLARAAEEKEGGFSNLV